MSGNDILYYAAFLLIFIKAYYLRKQIKMILGISLTSGLGIGIIIVVVGYGVYRFFKPKIDRWRNK